MKVSESIFLVNEWNDDISPRIFVTEFLLVVLVLLDRPNAHHVCASDQEEPRWSASSASAHTPAQRGRRTRIAAGHAAHDEPADDLEEVVRAGDFAEAVPVRDGACFRARRPEVAQGHVCLQVRQFGPLERRYRC